MQSDADLVGEVLGGSRAAFGTLVERYERAALTIAFQVLRDREAARDAVQEAFCTAYLKLSTLRNHADFGKWLLRIARNQAISELRRRRHAPPTRTLEQSSCPTTEHRHDRLTELLLDALILLPEAERQVVLMRFFEGLSVADIAKATSRPTGTVTKQLSRAYQHLRQALTEPGPTADKVSVAEPAETGRLEA